MRRNSVTFFRCLLMLIVCWFICPADAAMADAPPTMPVAGLGVVSMRVLWTISGFFLGRNAAWGEQEAKGLLFTSLDISENQISFNGEACKGVHFQKEMMDAREYLQKVWQVTPQELGVADRQIQVVKTNCRLPGFQEYLRLSDNRLLVPIRGIFFYFEPVLAR